jgi:spore coat polysaccharide biosynthesis protein SpsF (cytidylyltransferase family)
MEQCLALKELGFTVVKAPNDWRYNYYNNPEKWQDVVIRCAMDRVTLAANADRLGQTVSGYDSDLADTVLESLSKSFPEFVSLAELKYARL